MKVKAILWTHAPTKEGTCAIRFYVYAKGKKQYYPSGLRVLPEHWSETKEKVVGLPSYIRDSYNAVIEQKKKEFLHRLTKGVPVKELMTTEEKEHRSLIGFLDQYISELKQGLHDISPSTAKSYQSVLTRLKQYCAEHKLKDLAFESISLDWYRDYYQWIITQKIGPSSFDKAIKILKKVMRIAQERGLHDNGIYQHPEFKRQRTKTDKIYLTREEIEQIATLDLSTMEHLAKERDRFMINYYFVMRWEDSVRIEKPNIIKHDGLNYSYTANKTGVHCIIPVSSKAEILLKQRSYNFNFDSCQKSNVKIKEICMLAGVTRF